MRYLSYIVVAAIVALILAIAFVPWAHTVPTAFLRAAGMAIAAILLFFVVSYFISWLLSRNKYAAMHTIGSDYDPTRPMYRDEPGVNVATAIEPAVARANPTVINQQFL